MCGIVGYVGTRSCLPILIEGLKRLEYRGYDSSGVAIQQNGALKVIKAAGKIRELERRLAAAPPSGTAGIAHTRWATHGEPNDTNAHPHSDSHGHLALVHNGIIENYRAIKSALEAEGHRFRTETDTEVLTHLVEKYIRKGLNLERAVGEALRQVEGTYGIAVLHEDFPDRIVVARNGSPVVLGIGEHEMFVASDVAALVSHTRQVITLDDGEMATIKADDYRTYTTEGSRTASSRRSAVSLSCDSNSGSDDAITSPRTKRTFDRRGKLPLRRVPEYDG